MFPSGDIVGKAYRFVVNTIVHVRHVGFVNRFVHIQGLLGHAQHAARHRLESLRSLQTLTAHYCIIATIKLR